MSRIISIILIALLIVPCIINAEKMKVIHEDNRYTVFDNGVVRDAKTGLDWISWNDKATNWYGAKRWVESVNKKEIAGGGWRMPKITELKKMEDPTKSLLKIANWWVWSGDKKDRSFMWFFLFDHNFVGFNSPYLRNHHLRALAVRSIK